MINSSACLTVTIMRQTEHGGNRTMKIAIIDDSPADRQSLAEHLHTYKKTHKIACALQEFVCAEDFFKCFVPGAFDLVFLDIYMKEMDGMEAARKIYETDKHCKIIFLTVSMEHAQLSYSVHAVYYLMKPLDQTQFEQAMAFCNFRPENTVPFLSLEIDGVRQQIDTRQILYIDYQNRMVHIHFSKYALSLNKSFRDITSLLETDARFLTIFRGVMVNMQHIARHEDIFFVLDNGKRLQITIRSKKAIAQAYRNYVFSHMED